MNRFVLAALAAVMATGAAAAERPWSGFYLGAVGGYGASHGDVTVAGAPAGDVNAKGALLGARAGFDQRVGVLAFGLVGDWSWSGMKESQTIGGATVDAKLTQYATLRARAGVAAGDWVMFYATGGGAYGRATVVATVPGLGESTSSVGRLGWVVGGGVEVALTPRMSVGVEYLHADLGRADLDVFGVPTSARIQPKVVRASLSYRF